MRRANKGHEYDNEESALTYSFHSKPRVDQLTRWNMPIRVFKNLIISSGKNSNFDHQLGYLLPKKPHIKEFRHIITNDSSGL